MRGLLHAHRSRRPDALPGLFSSRTTSEHEGSLSLGKGERLAFVFVENRFLSKRRERRVRCGNAPRPFPSRWVRSGRGPRRFRRAGAPLPVGGALGRGRGVPALWPPAGPAVVGSARVIRRALRSEWVVRGDEARAPRCPAAGLSQLLQLGRRRPQTALGTFLHFSLECPSLVPFQLPTLYRLHYTTAPFVM